MKLTLHWHFQPDKCDYGCGQDFTISPPQMTLTSQEKQFISIFYWLIKLSKYNFDLNLNIILKANVCLTAFTF